MMRAFLAYARIEHLWERFSPDTPFGRDVKEQRVIHTDAAPLARIWDETDAALALLDALRGSPVTLDRIRHHLKRLPRFPEEPRAVFDELELFQVKKFLHNYRALVQLLGAEARHAFALSWSSDVLFALLDRGRQSAESFYISDEYSADLARVRGEIREVDDGLRVARRKRAEEIEAAWGIVFNGQEFVVASRDGLGDLSNAGGLLLLEPYDELNVVARPLRSPEELALSERRASLALQERASEDEVLETLSYAVRGELERLKEYRAAARTLDVALARARMAREGGFTRPMLAEISGGLEIGSPSARSSRAEAAGGAIDIRQGRLLPCEDACRARGTRYEPLDATFDHAVTVLFGSNMGGKTVVLQTLAFLQACAQAGFFVPAERFATRVFRHFHYVGEGAVREEAQGLSGFGFEMKQLMEAWSDFGEPTLVLFDEFARTTQSREAEALLSAVIEALTREPRVLALFATHFRGVRRLSGARYLRMKGLNREGLDLGAAAGADLEERIRRVDRRMEYRLVRDDGHPSVSDAIAVAGLLGVHPDLVARAMTFFSSES